MNDRRRFIKTVTATAGAVVLPATTVSAQETNKILPPIISMLLNDPMVVTTAAAASTSIVASPFRIIPMAANTGGAGQATLTIAPAPVEPT